MFGFTRAFNSIKGIAAILFGVFLLLFPGFSLLSLALGFGVFALLAGIALVIFTLFVYRKGKFRAFFFLEGVVDLLTGIFIFIYPRLSVSFFMVIIGIWIVFLGIVLLILYRDSLKTGEKNRNLFYWGLFIFFMGIFLIFNPFRSAIAVSLVIGTVSVIYGISSLYYGVFRQKKYS